MSFRDLRTVRVSRQSNRSFVFPHITDVQAWRASVEQPSGRNSPQDQAPEEQLFWTVDDKDKDIPEEAEEEEEEEEEEDFDNGIEHDEERKEFDAEMPAPQLEQTDLLHDARISMAEPSVNEEVHPKAETQRTVTNAVPPSSEDRSVIPPMGTSTDADMSNLSISNTSSSTLYTEMPPTVEIKRSKKRGRGLWAREFIKAGTTILTTKPRAYVLSRSQLEMFCSACSGARPVTGLKKCGKCKVVHYCGPACQNADWEAHKPECDALRRWATSASYASTAGSSSAAQSESDEGGEDGGNKEADQDVKEEYNSIPSEAIRCLARIMWRRKKEGSGSTWWKEINEMQSHRDNLAQIMVNAHVHLAHGIVRYMGMGSAHDLARFEVRGVGELVDLISKFTSNSFTLATPSLSPIGVAISPLAALINHSCNPNVAVVFPRFSSAKEEPLIHVVAIQDIQANAELFTSYIDITLPRAQRQKDLKETYNFTCECELCKQSTDSDNGQVSGEDWRERLWCPKRCGGTCPLPLTDDDEVRCNKCGVQVSHVSKVVDAMRVGQDALDKANALQFSDPERAIKLTRNAIPLLIQTGLPPSSHPLLALYRLQQGLLISTFSDSEKLTKELLDETICSAAKAAAGLDNVLCPGHPVRALALAELGKLLAVDEPSSTNSSPSETTFPPSGPARLQLAMQALQQAYAELLIAFGKGPQDGGGGAVGREVRELLVNLEKELGIWNKRIGQTLKDTLTEQKGGVVEVQR